MKINSALKRDFSVDNGFHHLLRIALGTVEMVHQLPAGSALTEDLISLTVPHLITLLPLTVAPQDLLPLLTSMENVLIYINPQVHTHTSLFIILLL